MTWCLRAPPPRSSPVAFVLSIIIIGTGGKVVNIRLTSNTFSEVTDLFERKWNISKGQPPKVYFVFKINNSLVTERWQVYRKSLYNNYVEKYFHGTTLSCHLEDTQQLCDDIECGICGISKNGFDSSCIESKFQRFGHGFYLAPNSSKSHDYTKESCSGYHAMLLCEVCPGKKFKCTERNTNLTSPPHGYNSVYGKTGKELNYEEITLFESDAILPKFIIIYAYNLKPLKPKNMSAAPHESNCVLL